jgi:glycine/D-amino acid oxidase-like deaminating enzyme
MKSYEVVIIGRGLTALGVAWHLKRLGIKRICLVAPPRSSHNCASFLAHTATASLHENISRTVHNLGAPISRDLLDLTRRGFSQLANFVADWNLPHSVGEVLRFSLSDHETTEMDVATEWLNQHGFAASHDKNSASSQFFSTQFDGAASLSFDVKLFLETLEKEANVESFSTKIVSIYTDTKGATLSTPSSSKYHCELVVVACHDGIKQLVPDLAPALINHADQRIEFKILNGNIQLKPGDHALAGHNHYWLTYSHQRTLITGGARFLRKWGGVEADEAPVISDITKTVKEKWEQILKIKLSTPLATTGFIELYGCDELPIIGPMFGQSRILVASGYMNSGASFSLAAAQGLAELITKGYSTAVSPNFWPARLRSLPESS